MKKGFKKLIVLFACLGVLLSFSMVQVYAAPSLSAKKISVYVGKTKQLKVRGTSSRVKWTVNNSKVATVSSKGVIKGKKAGKAVVTAATAGKRLRCTVTVKNVNAKARSITFKTTDGGDFILNSAKANVKFKMAANSTGVKVSVVDATGKVYYSKTFSSCKKNKEYSFQWNGKTSKGKNVGAGAYRICVTAGTTKTYSGFLRVYAKTDFAGGNGSSSNPYKVSNLAQLRKISLYPDKHFVQVANINGGYESFQPMCTIDAPFSGTYNGQGYTISTLNISTASETGLFVAVSGTVSNVKIDSFLVNGQDRYDVHGIGTIAARNSGKIVNCVVSNSNIAGPTSNSCGGICGINDGIIQNCTAQNVTAKTSGYSNGEASAGGITGRNRGSIISCSAENINTAGWKAGGITGFNEGNGQCVMCEATGIIKVNVEDYSGTYEGAIAGYNEGTISSCSTTSGLKLAGSGSGIVA